MTMKLTDTTTHSTQCQNSDEYRLLEFFRMMDERQRDALLVQAGRTVADRCFPSVNIFEFQPGTSFYAEPKRLKEHSMQGDIADACAYYTGFEWLAGGEPDWIFEALDEASVQSFTRRVNECLATTASELSTTHASLILERWKLNVMIAIRNRYLDVPTTADEARDLPVRVPDCVEGWKDFAVSIDGDAIAEELGLAYPGERFEWLFEPEDEPDVAEVRLMLLHWYRRSLSQDGKHGPPRDAEIMAALDWLRERLESPDDASEGKGKPTDE